MLCGAAAACSGGNSSDESSGTVGSEETANTELETSNDRTEAVTSDETENESSSDTEEPPVDVDVSIDSPYSDAIIYADALKNGVQSYYPDGVNRDRYYVENLDMNAEFALRSGSGQKLTYLNNTKGGTYISDTMDVFIRMKDGKTYYASGSSDNARVNVYRIGYYYYDVRILEQNFYTDPTVVKEYDIDESLFNKHNDVSRIKKIDGGFAYVVSGNDPYVYCSSNAISFSSEEYDAIRFTIKTQTSSNAQLFVSTDENKQYNARQSIAFEVVCDGEFHTYTVMLSSLPEYTGNVIGFRLDLGQTGELVEVKDMRAVKLESDSPYVKLDRTWHTYSDKLHQELHFVAPMGQDNIDALGMITEIAADTVEKLTVKDASGTHDSLDEVDWSTAEYVGFDIKDAGIFGYIMPADNASGSISVTLEGENYVIVQEASPENGEIRSPAEVGNTSNDFFMGQRIYTDESHDFAEFIKEAEFERDPLGVVYGDSFVKYDALRGAYLFDIGGTTFNSPFFSSWNQHFSAEIAVRARDSDRKLYIRTSTTSGCLENAVMLTDDGLLIPIPLEVSKNFGELEEPIMNYGDTTYGETVFPFYAEKDEKYVFKILNLYQNWGKFPIKQLSSIAYYAPYYHLSIGVTETTCISPWYVRGRTLWTLPDFRSQSAPYWFELEGDAFKNEPQHTHAGAYKIIHYTDALGNFVASENYKNTVLSSGPIYAEVQMDYLSDDGKMKISYNHLELPQTDELRPFYQVKIEMLEDITFDNLKNDFTFYAWNTARTRVGYLNADGEHVEAKYSNEDDVTEYVLGKTGGYFGNFGTSSANATNLGFVIHSSELYVDGELFDGNFVVVENGENGFRLTLDHSKATLKKGDILTLNIIVLPWGSHLSTDADNLAYVRENSVIDPFRVTAEKGEIIDSVYLPRVKSDDGLSAEFTVSGGVNNAAVRVYGFNKLTMPKIYEKIDGNWVEYEVSSVDSPDAVGLRHNYDGYMTYYDGDGTFSYAFAFSMDGYESRTFKVEAADDFEPLPEIEIVNNDPINVYLDPYELSAKLTNSFPGVGSATLSDNADYIRITGDGKDVVEVRVDVFSAMSEDPTGQYLVVKYRIPNTNPNDRFEFFASTVNTSVKGMDSIWLSPSLTVQDDEWHVLVVDASTYKTETFVADSDGQYYAKYICLDIFNTPMGTDDYVDIAYIGIFDDMEKFRSLDANADVAEYTVSSKSKTEVYSMTTGALISSTEIGEKPGTPVDDGVSMSKDASAFIDPSNSYGYTASGVQYFGRVDSINGFGPKGMLEVPYNNRGSNNNEGVATFQFDNTTTADYYLAIAGWSLFYGGVEKYVWSADGGKTWSDVELYNRSSLGAAGTGMINYANKAFGKTDFELYSANSAYQGLTKGHESCSGLGADLSAFEGQTVSVTFAAVPSAAKNTLCVLAHVTGVLVQAPASDEEDTSSTETETEAPIVEAENPYNDPINYYMDASEMYEAFGGSSVAGVGSMTLSEDGSYITFTGDGGDTDEVKLDVYAAAENIATGQYIAIKYRMPESNSKKNYLQVFTSTVNTSAKGSDSITLINSLNHGDGEWHVLIVDASSMLTESFVSQGGKYFCKYARFDVFNTPMPADSSVDIAYFGISDSLEDICALDANAEFDMIPIQYSGGTVRYINTATGEISDNADGTNNPEDTGSEEEPEEQESVKISVVQDTSQFIDANNSQGFAVSDVAYFSRIDTINGKGRTGSVAATVDAGSNNKEVVAVIEYNNASTNDKHLVIAGWCLTFGGAEKYVWSADGGKTWNDVTLYGISVIGSAYQGILNYTANKYGDEVDFSGSVANSVYQGVTGEPKGIGADLSAYAGQTVAVTFAAVPASDTDSLCILAHVKGVAVASDEE